MRYKISGNKNTSASDSQSHQLEEFVKGVDYTQLEISNKTNQSTNVHQITSADRPLRSQHRHYYRSYFRLGIFWGAVVSFTAIFSAGCGVALTKIDAVEQAIANKIAVNFTAKTTATSASLTTPLNVLLIETKTDFDSKFELSGNFTDENQTILVIKFDPQVGSTRVINIPLDSRVKIPGHGWGTVADAHQYGGTILVSQMVEQLMNGVAIDRYIRAEPKTYQKLTASGKLTLADCVPQVQDCADPFEQVIRQENTLKTIRQRLNIPAYLDQFKTTLTRLEPNLDSNLSVAEFMALANFAKELDRDNISVNLLPGYTPSKTITRDIEGITPTYYHQENMSDEITAQPPLSQLMVNTPQKRMRSGQNSSIAVQNTTNSPELGMRVVNYLRSQNYRDVYLVEHIPLELDRTKIVVNQKQIEKANRLRSVLGFGNLKPTSDARHQELTIRIGEDAQYVFLDKHSYN